MTCVIDEHSEKINDPIDVTDDGIEILENKLNEINDLSCAFNDGVVI